ncbi:MULTISPECIES: hypothetical protein [Lactobacillaceae]|uniref:hypothetical protein n=1 Tax=Lactobacillaceae TaxID=33958 RepID=UPI000C1B6B8A|nr:MULTISPECIES: hypothetical protein [Lactobacillaceae]
MSMFSFEDKVNSLVESIFSFDIKSDEDLIDMVMGHVNEMDEEDVDQHMNQLDVELTEFDSKTDRQHARSVDELKFKLNMLSED